MALKFKCRECGEYIITKFLKVGETAKCRNCGIENVVPENALETNEEPKHETPTGMEPETAAKVHGKVRPVESVIGLSIITLSIYFWVYLFKTLREMKNTFRFDAEKINPHKVKAILIAYLVVSLLVAIIDEVIGWPWRAQGYTSVSTGLYAWLVISTVASVILFVVFSSSFVRLIEVCQRKGLMVPLNRSSFWILIAINAVWYFVFIGAATYTYPMLIALIGLVAFMVFLYLIVNQVNRIWTESRGMGGP